VTKIGEEYFLCSDKKEIFYRFACPKQSKAHIIICHGYGEHSGRYEYVIQTLAAKGFTCFAPDHRGHGKSAKRLGHIKSFKRIIQDIHDLQFFIREKYGTLPLFLIGHSMGSLVVLNYLFSYQKAIQGAVLIAPMIIIPDYISPVLKKISGLIAALFPLLPIQHFDISETTRNLKAIEIARQDPLCYHGKIRARTGVEMMKAMETANANLSLVTLPLLIMQGGEDKILPLESSDRVFRRVSSPDKALKVFKGLYHELFNEPEKDSVIQYLAHWIETKLK
jgi:acylglycerol lipase